MITDETIWCELEFKGFSTMIELPILCLYVVYVPLNSMTFTADRY